MRLLYNNYNNISLIYNKCKLVAYLATCIVRSIGPFDGVPLKGFSSASSLLQVRAVLGSSPGKLPATRALGQGPGKSWPRGVSFVTPIS